jgi:hypothetical protein
LHKILITINLEIEKHIYKIFFSYLFGDLLSKLLR